MFRRLLALSSGFVVAALAILLPSCESSPTKYTTRTTAQPSAPSVRSESFIPMVAGDAAFIELSEDLDAFRFFLRGSYLSQSDGEVKLLSIDVSGAPGRPAKAKKLTPLAKITEFEADGSWKVDGADLGDNAKFLLVKTADLGKKLKLRDFTLRTEFNYLDTGSGKKGTETRTWWISTVGDPTPAIAGKKIAGPGDTIANVTGSGTFHGAQRIAIYDLHVDFNNGDLIQEIEIFSGPAPDPTSKIYSQTYSNPLDTAFDIVGLSGRYNGIGPTYYVKIVATDTNNHSDQATVNFPNTNTNDGVTIPISSWIPLD